GGQLRLGIFQTGVFGELCSDGFGAFRSGLDIEAVEQAFAKARPKIINSDQGSQYTSPAYIQRVESAGVRISMDGRGRALDNVFTERFWRSLKYEEVYLNDYVTPRQTRQSISGYLEYYNERRPHQALNYQTPATVYAGTGVELSAIISE